MIVSDIQHWDQEKQYYPRVLNQAIEYIKSQDLSALPAGKYPIEGDLMFALIQEPLTGHTPYLEAHETYIDLQYLIAGEERIGVYRPLKVLEVIGNSLATKDVILYKHDEKETDIILQPGMFAVFFPSDLHRPCCNVGEEMKIKKVVVKIHKQLLERT